MVEPALKKNALDLSVKTPFACLTQLVLLRFTKRFQTIQVQLDFGIFDGNKSSMKFPFLPPPGGPGFQRAASFPWVFCVGWSFKVADLSRIHVRKQAATGDNTYQVMTQP